MSGRLRVFGIAFALAVLISCATTVSYTHLRAHET